MCRLKARNIIFCNLFSFNKKYDIHSSLVLYLFKIKYYCFKQWILTNGVVERFNATFIPQISKLQDNQHNNWDESCNNFHLLHLVYFCKNIYVYIIFICACAPGESVRTGKGSVCAFIRNTEDDIEDRNNELYDEHILILSRVITVLFQIRKNLISLLN